MASLTATSHHMRPNVLCLLIAGMAWSGFFNLHVLSAQQRPTQWDGIYTTAQAKRGEPQFMNKCAYCHRDEATGGQQIQITPAPPLSGPDFARRWDNRSLDQLLTTIYATMPQWEGGTLSRQEAADILAFILQDSSYPAGAFELPPDADMLEAMTFTVQKGH